MEDKIIQLCPVNKELYATYKMEDGSIDYVPIVAIALTENGEMYYLDVESLSVDLNPEDTENFTGYHYPAKVINNK